MPHQRDAIINQFQPWFSDAFDSPIGWNHGPYALLEPMGQGGNGAVFIALDTNDGRLAAVKLVRQDNLGTDAVLRTERLRRFQNEISKMQTFSSPRVVQIWDHGEIPNPGGIGDSLPFLAMEFIPGRTLRDQLNKWKRLPLPETLEISLALCEGLAALHDLDIIHRDVKPDNIMIDAFRANSTMLLDLGLAYHADDDENRITATGIPGTPNFMPIERFHEPLKVSTSWDLFALGCVIYEMLTGTLAFKSSHEILRKVVPKEPIQIVPTVSPGLNALVMQLIDHAVGNRPQTVHEVYTVLSSMRPQVYAAKGALSADWNFPSDLPRDQIQRAAERNCCMSGDKFRGHAGEMLGLAALSRSLSELFEIISNVIGHSLRNLALDLQNATQGTTAAYLEITANQHRKSIQDVVISYVQSTRGTRQALSGFPEEDALQATVHRDLKEFHDLSLHALVGFEGLPAPGRTQTLADAFAKTRRLIRNLTIVSQKIVSRQIICQDQFASLVEFIESR